MVQQGRVRRVSAGRRVAGWAAAVLVGACGAASLAAGAAQPEQGAGVTAPNAPRKVDPQLLREFGGTKAELKPIHNAVMGFSLPTQVLEILAKGGQEVRKGDLLIRGDDREDVALLKLQQMRAESSDLRVDRARKAMELAKVEYERLVDIQKKGASGVQEVERARLQYEVSDIDFRIARDEQAQEAVQLERLRARVEKFHMIAPFDGQVDSVQCDLGQAVSENEKVIRVVSVDPLWIDVPAPMQDPATLGLANDAPAWVLIDFAGEARVLPGKVVEVAPTADISSRTRRVRVELPNPKGERRLIAGEPCWVRFTEPAVAAGAGEQRAAREK